MKILEIYDDYYVCACENNSTPFKIDIKDYIKASRYHWYWQKNGISGHIDGRAMMLSHFLMGISEKNVKVLRRNKDTFDYRRSNLYTGNIYHDKGNHFEVECFDGRVFIVSKTSEDLVKKYQWHIDKNGYVITKTKEERIIKLHRLLLDVIDDHAIEVDHINRDTFDNRVENLRLSNRSLNCYNRDTAKYNKSGVIGVYPMFGYVDKWCVQINHNGKRYYLGSYDDFDKAVAARRAAELNLFGF